MAYISNISEIRRIREAAAAVNALNPSPSTPAQSINPLNSSIMRKVMIGMFFLGLTSLTYGQQTEGVAQEVELSVVTVSASNADFLQAVQDHQTPAAARALESMAANFKLKESPIYNRYDEAFEVRFKNSLGSISAVYSNDGDMLSAYERIKNVSPPASLRAEIYQDNPGWTITKSAYLVSYYRGEDAVRKYKAQLSNGKKKKTIKLEIPKTSDTAGELDAIVASNSRK